MNNEKVKNDEINLDEIKELENLFRTYKDVIQLQKQSNKRIYTLLIIFIVLLFVIIGVYIGKDIYFDRYREESITKTELIETINSYHLNEGN